MATPFTATRARPSCGRSRSAMSNPQRIFRRETSDAATDRGADLDEIARTLFLSRGTVRNHLSNAIQKLGAKNRSEAARLAEAKGWL